MLTHGVTNITSTASCDAKYVTSSSPAEAKLNIFLTNNVVEVEWIHKSLSGIFQKSTGIELSVDFFNLISGQPSSQALLVSWSSPPE